MRRSLLTLLLPLALAAQKTHVDYTRDVHPILATRCFLSAYLQAHNVKPAPLVNDVTFARRVYLDVWGLVPSPEQLDAFLSDRSATKRQTLVRQLLADNDNYTENWVSYWNDLLRNDEG